MNETLPYNSQTEVRQKQVDDAYEAHQQFLLGEDYRPPNRPVIPVAISRMSADGCWKEAAPFGGEPINLP